MKYTIIGLGYFGASLAAKLTAMGHEVIGIDRHPERAEELKDKITRVMVMDSSKPAALNALPLADCDAVVVAIGEDIAASIMTLSVLKKLNLKRLIGRAINPIHHNILQELGIEEIIHPEEDTATEVASMLMLSDTVNAMIVNDRNIIAEIKIPAQYAGHSLDAANLQERFGIKPVAVKIAPPDKGLGALLNKDFTVDLECDARRILSEKDRLIVIGDIDKIKLFLE